MSLSAVFDTNVVVSALLFRHGHLSVLRDIWRSQQVTPLVSHTTTKELLRVLAYPKFKLLPGEIEDLLSDYLPYAQVVARIQTTDSLPTCRDIHDQIFLELAFAGHCDFLVTGDADLLILKDLCPFTILPPGDFIHLMDNSAQE
jgi:putative PIN family toxin of toxin-antitoxin system